MEFSLFDIVNGDIAVFVTALYLMQYKMFPVTTITYESQSEQHRQVLFQCFWRDASLLPYLVWCEIMDYTTSFRNTSTKTNIEAHCFLQRLIAFKRSEYFTTNVFHSYRIKKGKPQKRTPVSLR